MRRAYGLRLRLVLLVIGICGGAICLFAGAFYLTLQATLMTSTDARLRERAALIASLIQDAVAEQPAQLPALPPLVEFNAPGIYVELRDPAGRLLAASPNLGADQLPAPPELLARAQTGGVSATVRAGDDEDVRLLVLPAPSYTGANLLLVAESLEPSQLLERQARELLLWSGALTLMVAMGGALLLTGVALAPMARLTAAARQIAATGHYHLRVPQPRQNDEVGQLAATINDLIATVGRTLGQQRQLLADTSHELRSPLTVVLANLDLLRRELRPEERQISVGEASTEARRMKRLVNDLLLLAQPDAAQVIARAPLAFDELVAETVATVARQAPQHRLALRIQTPVRLSGDAERLTQAVRNVLENAVRYTSPGTEVTVEVGSAGGQASLAVADTGPGIAPEHLPLVWDRFYRVDKARSRAAGGSGLGLAITKFIVEAHGGAVCMHSSLGQGTTVRLLLPLHPAERRAASERGAAQAAG
ncbi:MAG TPA: HAMP domain-containing sensor histidine kinase [Roseiflexaceae bacterium]|nr:HAMP domain-containing sensor histidine kinase [Roseiflexaceae bacterium]